MPTVKTSMMTWETACECPLSPDVKQEVETFYMDGFEAPVAQTVTGETVFCAKCQTKYVPVIPPPPLYKFMDDTDSTLPLYTSCAVPIAGRDNRKD